MSKCDCRNYQFDVVIIIDGWLSCLMKKCFWCVRESDVTYRWEKNEVNVYTL